MLTLSVLVTGANRGIGLEFVRQLTRLGDAPRHVFAACRDPSAASELKKIAEDSKTSKVYLLKLDVGDDGSIVAAAKEVGEAVGEDGLSLIINNAGIMDPEHSKIPNLTRDNLLKHFSVNTCSPLLITQAFLPLLRKAAAHHPGEAMSVARAAVINISSGLGSIGDNTSGSAFGGFGYRCSKAAVNQVIRCLGVDLKKDGILCLNFCPGWVKTDMGSAQAQLTPEESIGAMLQSMRSFNKEHTGGFFNRNGKPMTW